jgi:pantoate--beta-alanine ligase
MLLIKKVDDLISIIGKKRKAGLSIGFVPTMGALHAGHISLLETSKRENRLTVCSIFVNPTQFNNQKDFDNYPVTIEKDIYLLEKAGTDTLFFPSPDEIYPHTMQKPGLYDLGYLETILEGKYRPGHFQGVCQVVHRLLEIIRPDNLYMGQKDYQQVQIIKKLLALTGLNESVKLRVCPTMREPDGLAMSSRNLRLSEEDRKKAVAISQALNNIKENLKRKSIDLLIAEAKDFLTMRGFKTDYIEIADARTLEPVKNWDGTQKMIALAAAALNEIRLIDNLILN